MDKCSALKERRQAQSLYSLLKVPPTSSEAATLHSVYLNDLKQVHGSENYERVWMENTNLEKTMIMFPQERK